MPQRNDDLRAKALQVHERLCAAYECPFPYLPGMDPLGEMASSLLALGTDPGVARRAFRELRTRLPTWEAVRDAPEAEVREAVSTVARPGWKAGRLQAALRRITELRGELSLGFLGKMPPGEAHAWLRQVPGIGPRTRAATLALSTLEVAALVVDADHHRVADRLGLLPDGTPIGPAHALLEAQLPREWTVEQMYDHHEAMKLHGQRCCYPRNPECRRCPVLELCPYGRSRVGSRRKKG